MNSERDNEYAHPPGFECPDGPRAECIGCGARDCPYGEPLHYHHDGCPACYRAFQAQHASEDAKKAAEQTVAANQVAANQVAAEREDALEAEMSSLNLGAQIGEQGPELAAILTAHGARPGATDNYPAANAEWTPLDVRAIREVAERYQAGNLDLNSLVYLLSGVAWGVCDWGSCQYATALAMFRALRALKVADLDPTAVVGWGPSAEVIPAPIPLPEALAKIATGLAAQIREYAEDSGEVPDAEELATVESLAEATSLDPAFEAMRGQAWDLWTASAHTAQLIFRTDFAGVEGNVAASPGVGPSMNILAQSENYTTALRCYALVEIGYVQDPDGAFGGFDT